MSDACSLLPRAPSASLSAARDAEPSAPPEVPMTIASRPSSRRLVLLLGAAPLLLALAGCTGDARRNSRSRAAEATNDGNNPTAPARPGDVRLTNEDLAPMDAYLKRRFWVLGDDVEVVASKEYFIQNLSIAATTGYVKREDKEGADEAQSILTFLGTPEQADVTTSPRVSIGLGLTVFARKRLVIRFTRTSSPDLPVRLRIAANGKARIGAGNDGHRRGESIVVGAQIRRDSTGAYVFEEQ